MKLVLEKGMFEHNLYRYALFYMVVSDNPEIIAFHKIVG